MFLIMKKESKRKISMVEGKEKKLVLVLRYEAISLQVLILKEFIFSPLTINHPSPSYVKTVFILAQTAADVA